jgi:hypothetical protein
MLAFLPGAENRERLVVLCQLSLLILAWLPKQPSPRCVHVLFTNMYSLLFLRFLFWSPANLIPAIRALTRAAMLAPDRPHSTWHFN